MDPDILLSLQKARPKLENHYTLEYPIGEGSYAVVYRAKCLKDGRCVAVKVFRDTSKRHGALVSAIREIKLLRELREDKPIVRLEDIFMDIQNHCIFLVYEYGEHDLYSIITEQLRDKRTQLPIVHVKYLMQEILKGLAYLHNNWVIHRDVKPSNILVMGTEAMENAGKVKLADFGLARIFQDPLRPLSEDGEVVTYMYRAPELLLQSKHYTRSIDMWAAGCIFAELVTLNPLFAGQELKDMPNQLQIDQIRKVFSIMGPPTTELWPELVDMPAYDSIQDLLKAAPTEPQLRKAVYMTDPNAWDLLQRLLDYNPANRITAEEAWNHTWFTTAPLPQPLPVTKYRQRPEVKLQLHTEPQVEKHTRKRHKAM